MIAAGRVDRHRHRDVAEVDAGEQRLHVVERVDRHALAADLAERARMVGVVAHQRRHVERGREPGLPVVEQVAEALVGLLGGAEAGELAHRPQAAPVHARVDAARERILAREADPLLERADVLGTVERLDRLSRERRERLPALRRRRVELAEPALRLGPLPLLGRHQASLVSGIGASATLRRMPGRACRCTASASMLVARDRMPGAGRRGPAPPTAVEAPIHGTRARLAHRR